MSLKNPKHRLGSMSVSQLNDFLKATGRTKDMEKLKPYLFLARLEEKYPWVYSDTVLLSRAMGNIFNDNMIPYDILGLVGIVVLFIALSDKEFLAMGILLISGYLLTGWAGLDITI